MAFDIKVVQTAYKGKWKFEDMRSGSKIAVLFPNDLVQGDVGFNSIVRFPIMTKPKKQDDWSATTGFNETEAEEKTVEVRLSQNFTVYQRIAKINVPADPETWAANKVKMINRAEAAELDSFVLNEFGTKTTNNFTFDKITEDNFIDAIGELEKQAEAQLFDLRDAIIFISPAVATAIVKSKVQTVNLNLENVSADIKKVLDEYSVVKANIDTYGYQMIAVLPTAFSWLLGIETPLTAGEYIEGPYLGQMYVAENHFYGGAIAQPEFVIGMKIAESTKTAKNVVIRRDNRPKNDSSSIKSDVEEMFAPKTEQPAESVTENQEESGEQK